MSDEQQRPEGLTRCGSSSSRTKSSSPRRWPAGCAARAWPSTWPPTATTATARPSLTRYDVVVLDRDLPGMSGDEICRKLTDEGVLTRVMMLTASGTVEDKVQGLALGADDYLPKPFAFAELVARVRALGRRTTPAAPPVLTAGDIELDPAKRTVTRPAS